MIAVVVAVGVAAIVVPMLLRVTGLTNLGWMVTFAGPMRKGHVLRVIGCLGRGGGDLWPSSRATSVVRLEVKISCASTRARCGDWRMR
jgi:hypothetical protein